MKYAFMTFSTPSLKLAEVLEVAARYGYEGVEPRLDADHAHGIEVDASSQARERIWAEVARSGVELCCLATSLAFADAARREDMVEQCHRRIDLAGDLGVPALRVFGGKMGEGVGREQAIDLVAESLRRAAEHAAERQVTLCMETHDDWCDPTHMAAVMERASHPAVAVNWDIMHPVRTAGVPMDAAYEVLKPWIRHLHIHDGTLGQDLAFAPIGEGAIDHRRALELLMPAAYQGYISGEWIGWEPFEVHLPRELATMRRYEKELGGT